MTNKWSDLKKDNMFWLMIAGVSVVLTIMFVGWLLY